MEIETRESQRGLDGTSRGHSKRRKNPTIDVTELEKEEPPEETDLTPHEDDDDEDAEDPTGTAVAEAVVPLLRCAYGKHPPKP